MDINYWIAETLKAFVNSWDDVAFAIYSRWLLLLQEEDSDYEPDSRLSSILYFGARVVTVLLLALVVIVCMWIGTWTPQPSW